MIFKTVWPTSLKNFQGRGMRLMDMDSRVGEKAVVDDKGWPLTNQAPCIRHCIRWVRTNSNDSL